MAFEATVSLLRRDLSPDAFRKWHAQTARKELARVLSEEKDKPTVTRLVDGRVGVPEEAVKYGGIIRYEFARSSRIARDALELARQLSPVKSGAYKNSWFLMVDGKEVKTPPKDAKTITLTNDQPYHRKLEMTVNSAGGRTKTSFRRDPGIVRNVELQLIRKYGDTFAADIKFIELAGGYVLKGTRPKSRMVRDGKTGEMIRRVYSIKKDRRAGSRMTYPALIISPR